MTNGKLVNIPATLETLTPLHIGDGEEYIQGLDVLEYNGKKVIINPNRLFNHFKHDNDKIYRLTEELKNNSLNAFVRVNASEMKDLLDNGKIVNIDTMKNIKRHIRDGFGSAYIPGSSIKGSLRTAIISHILHKENYVFKTGDVNHNIKFADQQIVNRCLGKTPFVNLMKVLKVTDAYCENSPVCFYNIDVENTGRQNLKDVPFEMVDASKKFAFNINCENFYFEVDKSNKGAFNFKLDNFNNLVDIVDRNSLYMLYRHVLWNGYAQLKEAYQYIIDQFSKLDKNQVIMNIGAGAGWIGMTGDIIGGEMNSSIRDNLQLASDHLDFEYPKTRKFVKLDDGRKVPMGWVKVTFNGLERTHDLEKVQHEIKNNVKTVVDKIQKSLGAPVGPSANRPIPEGKIVEIKITSVGKPHSKAVTTEDNIQGSIYIGDISHTRIDNVEDYLKKGETKKAKIYYREVRGKVHLNFSLKDVKNGSDTYSDSQQGDTTYNPFKDLGKKK